MPSYCNKSRYTSPKNKSGSAVQKFDLYKINCGHIDWLHYSISRGGKQFKFRAISGKKSPLFHLQKSARAKATQAVAQLPKWLLSSALPKGSWHPSTPHCSKIWFFSPRDSFQWPLMASEAILTPKLLQEKLLSGEKKFKKSLVGMGFEPGTTW